MFELDQFTGLYQVTKTLRFELIPVGDTLSRIQAADIIQADTKLADSYQKMKVTLDAYHQDFIDRSLSVAELKGLSAFYSLYTASADEKRADGFSEKYAEAKAGLRSEVVGYFAKQPDFSDLKEGKKVVQNLKKWRNANDPDLYYDEAFERFTTYFSGYNQSRLNMYSDEEKSVAVAHRLIDENLPRFIDNLRTFTLVRNSPVAMHFSELCQDMQPWLNVHTLDEIFTLEYYNDVLTQPQIDAYNTIVGGRTIDNGKLKGLNEYINLYNQQHPDSKLPIMKMLFKQILSDRISASWIPESFASVQDVLNAVTAFCSSFHASDGALHMLTQAFDALGNADLHKVYIRESAITGISNHLFGNYAVLGDALQIDPDEHPDQKNRYRSISEIQSALDNYMTHEDCRTDLRLSGYSNNCVIHEWTQLSDISHELYYSINRAESAAGLLLQEKNASGNRLTFEGKEQLKTLLDSYMELLHYLRPLYPDAGSDLEKDELFYGSFMPAYEQLQAVTKLYDKVRNFATQKPYSTEKLRLNFNCNNGHLLDGWVDSRTENSDNGTQYGGYLLRRKNGIGEYDYYLGISANTKLFRFFAEVSPDDISEYERLDYYQPKSQSVYGSSYRGQESFAVRKAALLKAMQQYAQQKGYSKEIDAYCAKKDPTPSGCLILFPPEQLGGLMRDPQFSKLNGILIDELKDTMRGMKRLPGADQISKRDYALFTDIMEDIELLMPNKVFRYIAVSRSEMQAAMEHPEKPLHLFRISNKDLSYAESYLSGKRSSRGRPNLHTMYFLAMMSGNQSVYDLGTAEVFFRSRSIADNNRVIHPANQPLAAKNPLLHEKKSSFGYELIKDRRYTMDKFQLHLSMTANYRSPRQHRKLNEQVCSYLRNNPDVRIIGIDRGERHLLYLSMIDRNGNVVQDEHGNFIQYSLNTITGEYLDASGNAVTFETPYHDLLAQREAKRDEARKSWNTIEGIKDLKSGYLSQVVHHIASLMVKYNAIIVLEDLNSGFKNSRKKVEKQVYQNFEKALIEKLNYLVFKDFPENKPGGLYCALQLTNEFKSFRELTKQSGFLFYVPAWNTSKIDPVTGFVDLLKPKYQSVTDAIRFFRHFDAIFYQEKQDWFEFSFDYRNFTEKAEGTRTKWTVCTAGSLRYAFNRSLNNGKGGYEKWNVTEHLKQLFADYGIDWHCSDLIPVICGQKSADFFRRLIQNLQITLAMRYSCKEDEKDFILSPVADQNGVFFCSEGRCDGLPQDADANGAFNIARKGLMVLEQIDKAKKYGDWTTRVSNREWLRFVQGWSE